VVTIGRLLGVSKSAVVGKIDRLELPPPSVELQARKRRHAGRPPFWPANRIAKQRKLLGTSPTRRSAASLAFPRLQSSARRTGLDCRRCAEAGDRQHGQQEAAEVVTAASASLSSRTSVAAPTTASGCRARFEFSGVERIHTCL
jgi:hypothetical protein